MCWGKAKSTSLGSPQCKSSTVPPVQRPIPYPPDIDDSDDDYNDNDDGDNDGDYDYDDDNDCQFKSSTDPPEHSRPTPFQPVVDDLIMMIFVHA